MAYFRKTLRLFFITCLSFFTAIHLLKAQTPGASYPLIPYPSSLVANEGAFTATASTGIAGPAVFFNEMKLLSALFTNSFGKPLAVKSNGASLIRLVYDASITAPEGYKINSTNKSLVLSAKSAAGMFRAVQTIRQLLPPSIETKNSNAIKSLAIPAVTIEDQPAFSWRGIHIDVARHFFSMDYLRKQVDLMALYKFNKFHLHLTDDQGWRMEIKKYPKLTEEGAWRTFNRQDSMCMVLARTNSDYIIDPKHIVTKNGKTLYGGFYTQQQLKELVAYAKARHIDIIPEIDMPGHMMAAINSYLFLSCDNTSSFGELFSAPICPCKPETIRFAEDIYTEVMNVFPSEYIHIGGDEVERTHWERSEACQELMKKEGMKTTAELQAWFIKKMEKFFQSKGRKLLGWDEILEGGVSKTAGIMYWRTWLPNAPIEAARNGNKVIMAPVNPLYLSTQPDKSTLPAVYNYSIIPRDLEPAFAKNIIGAHAALWSETIPTEERADYLYMPYLTALAEATWSKNKDYSSYTRRLKSHYKRLDELKVSYRLPDLQLLNNYVFTDKLAFSVDKPIDNITLRYTTNGSVPDGNSPELPDPLMISQSQRLLIAPFSKDGKRGDSYNVVITQQQMAQPATVTIKGNGLNAIWYKKSFDSTTVVKGTPDNTFPVAGIVVPREAEVPAFTLQYRGYIEVPANGVYSFYLTSDDASFLRIAGREVVNNDGMHSAREKSGQVVLAKGLHPFALDFIEGGGGYTLKLQYSFNGSEPQDIPSTWFKN